MTKKALVPYDFPSAPLVNGATTWFVTPTGTNSTGTWGISITGSATGLSKVGAVGAQRGSMFLAQYQNNASSVTGAIVLELPAYVSATMVSYRFRAQFYADAIGDFIVQAYRNSATSWNNARLINVGSKTIQARLAYFNNKHYIVLGDTNTGWSYPDVVVYDLLTAFHGGALSSNHDGHSMSLVTDMTGWTFTTPTTQALATSITGNATTATTATTANAAPWSGITSKPTTLSGYGITDGEFRHANGVPRSNLGDPTVREMAIFDAQFNNKTDRFNIANLTFETSTDGVTWTEFTATDDQKRKLVGGDVSSSNLTIPNGTAYFRIKLRAVGYTAVSSLYSYFSTNGNFSEVTIWKKHDSGTIEQHTNSTTEVSSWPGHLYLPFSSIWWRDTAVLGSHYHEVYVQFKPRWVNASAINLYNIALWGGYPAGRRNLYTTDEFGNAVFPAAVSGSTAAVGTNTTQLATTAFVNAEIANDAPTKTGGGASGTWGINISGNATTSSSTDLVKVADNRAVDDAPSSFTQQRIRYDFKNRTAVGNPPSTPNGTTSYAYIATHNHWIGFDGGGGAAVQLNYGTEIDLRYATSASAWSAWKTLLSSTNFNTYAPTLTGTGASGTWGINILGNAGTATSATTAASAPLLTSAGEYVWTAASLASSYSTGLQVSFVQSANGFPNYGTLINAKGYASGGGGALQMYVPYSPTYGGTGLKVRFGNYDASGAWTSWKTLLADDNYTDYAVATTKSANIGAENTVSAVAYLQGISLFGQSDGALYSHVYSGDWKHQIFGDYRTGQLAVRGKNSGTWQAWRTVLDSSNYTDYTVTKTGTGASGTWPIAITGNANTVDGYHVQVDGAGTDPNTIYFKTTGGAISVPWTDITSKPTTVSGYGITDAVTTTGDQSIGGAKTFSSTIIGSVSGNAGTVTNGMTTTASSLGSAGVTHGTIVNSNNPIATLPNGVTSWETRSNGTGPAVMTFHRSGAYAGFFGLDTDNKWKVGGWSMGAVSYEVLNSKNNTTLQDDTRNTRGVTRLYRRDDDTDYSVQTNWTGSYWRLQGYNADTYHAPCIVDRADFATNAVNARTGSGTAIWHGSQAQYDAIGTKDGNTLYFIT